MSRRHRKRPNPRRRAAARGRAPIRSRLGGIIKPGAHPAVTARLLEGAADDFLRDDDDGAGIYQGRRSGRGSDDAELTPEERAKAVRNSRSAFKRSGAYGAVLDRITDFVLGDGVAIEIKDERTNAWIQELLGRPEIDWEGQLRKRVSRLLVDGEFLLSAYVQERDPGQPSGNVVLGRMDPLGISEVTALALNEDRLLTVEIDHGAGIPAICYPIAEEDGPLLRVTIDAEGKPHLAPLENAEGETARDRALIRLEAPREDAPDPEDGDPLEDVPEDPAADQPEDPRQADAQPVAEDAVLAAVFLWQINTLGTRGAPLLTRLLDKAAVLDEAVEELARKAEYLNRHWLHIEYEPSGDQEKDEAFEKRAMDWATQMEPGACLVTAKPNGSGGVQVHVKVADLKIQDQKALYELLLDYLLGSQGIPRMWFSSGGDTNRATAAEQGTPIFRSIRTLQSYVQGRIEAVVRWLIWLGSHAGAPVNTEADVEITMADVASRDSLRDVEEVSGLAIALRELVNTGALRQAESERILRKVLKAKWFGDLLEESDPDAGAEATDAPAEPTPPEGELDADALAPVAAPPAEGSSSAAEEGTEPTRLAPLEAPDARPEDQEMAPAPAAEPSGDPTPAAGGARKPSDALWAPGQITAITALIVQVSDGEVPLESAVQLMVQATPLSEEDARAILEPAEPEEPETPEGGAPTPPAPGAPPPPAPETPPAEGEGEEEETPAEEPATSEA